MQQLLRGADWDIDGVHDDVRDYAVEYVGEPGGGAICRSRGSQAGIGAVGRDSDEVELETKPRQAMAMLARAFEAGPPFA
jgi:hypothetical protein